jgi:arginase
MMNHRMIILNPQWQGSGATNEIKSGAKTIGHSFSECIDIEIELSEGDLSMHNNITGYHSIYTQLKRFRQLIHDHSPKKITTIGGDCSIEMIPVSYLNTLYDKLAVIWLDAHADLNTPESSPSKTLHGMPVRFLLGEGNEYFKQLLFSTVNTSQIFYVGLRDMDKAEEEYINTHHMFGMPGINYRRLKQKLDENNFTNLYIHLDLDVIDPGVFPYTKCPVPEGVKINDLETLMIQLQNDFEVVGHGICECTANKDEQLQPLKNILKLIKDHTIYFNH